jgi:hypothetical protein
MGLQHFFGNFFVIFSIFFRRLFAALGAPTPRLIDADPAAKISPPTPGLFSEHSQWGALGVWPMFLKM